MQYKKHDFHFLCLFIAQHIFLYSANAAYNKDVTCIIDKDKPPVCEMTPRPQRRGIPNDVIPSYDPYIPRSNSLLFTCTPTDCQPFSIHSLTQVTAPDLVIHACFYNEKYVCDIVKYHYLKNVDKLLFLSVNIRNKTFYMTDCLVYPDHGLVCHKQEDPTENETMYSKLVDFGQIARPKEPDSILLQGEFLCEQNKDGEVFCDLNNYVPYSDGLKMKQSTKYVDTILLKIGTSLTTLKRTCVENKWCGYSGHVTSETRRSYSYQPPGGKVYRCYYGNKQQVCKEWYSNDREVYNERGWLNDIS